MNRSLAQRGIEKLSGECSISLKTLSSFGVRALRLFRQGSVRIRVIPLGGEQDLLFAGQDHGAREIDKAPLVFQQEPAGCAGGGIAPERLQSLPAFVPNLGDAVVRLGRSAKRPQFVRERAAC